MSMSVVLSVLVCVDNVSFCCQCQSVLSVSAALLVSVCVDNVSL